MSFKRNVFTNVTNKSYFVAQKLQFTIKLESWYVTQAHIIPIRYFFFLQEKYILSFFIQNLLHKMQVPILSFFLHWVELSYFLPRKNLFLFNLNGSCQLLWVLFGCICIFLFETFSWFGVLSLFFLGFTTFDGWVSPSLSQDSFSSLSSIVEHSFSGSHVSSSSSVVNLVVELAENWSSLASHLVQRERKRARVFT